MSGSKLFTADTASHSNLVAEQPASYPPWPTAKMLPFGSRFQRPVESQSSLQSLLRNIEQGNPSAHFASDSKTLGKQAPHFWTHFVPRIERWRSNTRRSEPSQRPLAQLSQEISAGDSGRAKKSECALRIQTKTRARRARKDETRLPGRARKDEIRLYQRWTPTTRHPHHTTAP